MSRAIRAMRQNVLPAPGPATTSTGPSGASMAWRCAADGIRVRRVARGRGCSRSRRPGPSSRQCRPPRPRPSPPARGSSSRCRRRRAAPGRRPPCRPWPAAGRRPPRPRARGAVPPAGERTWPARRACIRSATAIPRLAHDHQVRRGRQVPVHGEQIRRGVETELAGAAGERADQREAALAPARVAGELMQAGQHDPRDAVGRRRRRVLHRLGPGRQQPRLGRRVPRAVSKKPPPSASQ